MEPQPKQSNFTDTYTHKIVSLPVVVRIEAQVSHQQLAFSAVSHLEGSYQQSQCLHMFCLGRLVGCAGCWVMVVPSCSLVLPLALLFWCGGSWVVGETLLPFTLHLCRTSVPWRRAGLVRGSIVLWHRGGSGEARYVFSVMLSLGIDGH